MLRNKFTARPTRVLGALLVMFVVSSCGKSTGGGTPTPPDSAPTPVAELTPSAEPSTAAAPSAPALDVPALLGKIGDAQDIIGWYRARESYVATGETNPEVEAALSAREAELLAANPAMPITESLDLLELQWKLDGESSAEGREDTFVVTWLFRVNKPVPVAEGHDVKLVLRGWFDKAHQQYFKENEKYVDLTYALDPPLSEWKAGSYHLISNKTYRKLPNLPYRLHTYFSELKQGDDGNWVFAGRLGEAADAGWHADLGAGGSTAQ